MAPTTEVWTSLCANRYQEGKSADAGSLQCLCGTYSIGVCSVCNGSACGDHSTLFKGIRLCSAHFIEAEAAALAEEESRRFDETERRWEEAEEHLGRFLAEMARRGNRGSFLLCDNKDVETFSSGVSNRTVVRLAKLERKYEDAGRSEAIEN